MTLDELKARAKQDLDNAFEKGKSQGGGGDEYYDKFWDDIQNYGDRDNYNYFAAYHPRITWFRPKYDIRPTKAQYFMRDCGAAVNDKDTENIIDLVDVLNKQGIVLDFSQCTSVTYAFYQARISHLPVLDLRAVTDTSINYAMFGGCVEIVDGMMVNEKAIMKETFNYASKMKHIIFGGVIAQDMKINQSDLLDAETYESIMSHCSKTASFTVTLPAETKVRSVFDAKYGSGAWDAITAQYPNVTIMYS